MNNAPVVLFVYNRPWHTCRVVESILTNAEASETPIYIFSDAPKNSKADEAVAAVRSFIWKITGFKSVTIIERAVNFGLAASIIDGVTRVCAEFGSVIVLEDDLVTSPYFLKFMNEGLVKYRDEEKVISIHGYVYPVEQNLKNPFFLRGADCWGWATWRRGWELFNPNGEYLLQKLRIQKLEKTFDFNGSYEFTNMLIDQIACVNDSWAIRWYASAFLQEKLTLYPGRSLVRNIGNDSSGTHCGDSTSFDVELSSSPVSLDSIEVIPCNVARNQFELYFRREKMKRLVGRFLRVGKLLVKKFYFAKLK